MRNQTVRMLKVREVAEILSMKERQVRELCWRGHLRSVKIGRHVRIPLRAIELLDRPSRRAQ